MQTPEIIRRCVGGNTDVLADIHNTTPTNAETQARPCTSRRQCVSALPVRPCTSEQPAVPGGPVLDPLYPYQRAGVEFLTATRKAILADAPGLGKTLQALTAIDLAHGFPCVVVTTAAGKAVWTREIAKWLPYATAVTLNGREPASVPAADFYIVNYEIAGAWSFFLRTLKAGGIIIDEAHRCRTGHTGTFEHIKSIAWSGRWGAPIFLLTGTPIVNRPRDLLSLLMLIGATKCLFGGQREFLYRYCDPRDVFVPEFENSDGDVSDTITTYNGAANLDELRRKLSPAMLRRSKEEVLPELPPKRRINLPVDELSNAREYRRAESDFIAWLREKGAATEKLSAAQRGEAIARINALRKLAGIGKVTAALEWTRDFLESGQSLIVFAHHHEVIDAMAAGLDARAIDGRTPTKRRAQLVAEFQAGKHPVLVCGTRAMGESVTLTAASEMETQLNLQSKIKIKLHLTPTARGVAKKGAARRAGCGLRSGATARAGRPGEWPSRTSGAVSWLGV